MLVKSLTRNKHSLAHLRGDEARKPFPEKVEKQLLQNLRDKKTNIWDKIFDENPDNVGAMRFRSKGFWEKKLDREAQELVSNVAEHNESESFPLFIAPMNVPSALESSLWLQIRDVMYAEGFREFAERIKYEYEAVIKNQYLSPAVQYFLVKKLIQMI